MATARDLINDSLRTLGVLASGEASTAAIAVDALTVLNERIEFLNMTGVTVYSIQPSTQSTTGAQGAYTLGTGGNWNITRPQYIDRLVYVSDNNDWMMAELTELEWQLATPKTLQSTIPTHWHDDDGYPLRTINLWPVPSVNASIKIYSWVQLGALASLDTTVDFPPGYRGFLRYELAVALAPEYEQPVSGVLAQLWRESKANVQRLNTRIEPMLVDVSLRRLGQRRTAWAGDIRRGPPW